MLHTYVLYGLPLVSLRSMLAANDSASFVTSDLVWLGSAVLAPGSWLLAPGSWLLAPGPQFLL